MDPEEYTIHGTVTDADGQELSYAEVTVWWQRIRERVPLATGDTSEEGHYHLSYRPPDDAPGKLLIVVEVRSDHAGCRRRSTAGGVRHCGRGVLCVSPARCAVSPPQSSARGESGFHAHRVPRSPYRFAYFRAHTGNPKAHAGNCRTATAG